MINVLIIGGNGYIGSKLKNTLSEYFNVDVCGKKYDDYNLLTKDFLNKYTHIILLAGHSSVLSCFGDLRGIWNNNVRNFKNLVDKLNDNQKLIYASSSSVYPINSENDFPFTEDMLNYSFVNYYDLTKMSLDVLSQGMINHGKNIIGLRFGTVNGASPILRTDIMINSMVYSAVTDGMINVSNRDVKRPILGLLDLCRAIYKIISVDFIPGIYNLASFNSTVGEIADKVGFALHIPIVETKGTNTYNFIIDCSKFKKVYNFEFNETIESIIHGVHDCVLDESVIKVKRDIYFDYRG